ncbi:MAG: ArgE/DapE family deacylase [Armatimonadetes bacterium]|jgi:acetylornithine deacetylase|nr:ArgE/DapE family deacylase [Armatimonadota bacterium]
MSESIRAAIEEKAEEAREFLLDLIQIKSVSGEENGAVRYCLGRFARVGCECKLIPLSDDIKNDPEYSHPETPVSYGGRSNLAVHKRGKGTGKSLILQTHIDTVPASGWEEAFTPRLEGGLIYGRGACDAKGHIAAIWLALAALENVSISGDLQTQIVVEEEFGGNGALAMIRQGYKADAVLVAESTEMHIHPANRGAIWFKIEIEGVPRHMGRKHEGISAIDLSCKVIDALYQYEKRIVEDSTGYPGFERYDKPVQVNVGMLHSGQWPSMVAANAEIEGGVGFLPNRSMEQVKREMKAAIESIDDPWLRDHYKLSFPKLHNDSYQTDYSHPAVVALHEACKQSGLDSDVFGWNVSCDARLYANLGQMPTMVFGAGSILDAHARDEKIDFKDILKSAEVMANFITAWCGVEAE